MKNNYEAAIEAAKKSARRARRDRLRLHKAQDDRHRQCGRILENLFPCKDPQALVVLEHYATWLQAEGWTWDRFREQFLDSAVPVAEVQAIMTNILGMSACEDQELSDPVDTDVHPEENDNEEDDQPDPEPPDDPDEEVIDIADILAGLPREPWEHKDDEGKS